MPASVAAFVGATAAADAAAVTGIATDAAIGAGVFGAGALGADLAASATGDVAAAAPDITGTFAAGGADAFAPTAADITGTISGVPAGATTATAADLTGTFPTLMSQTGGFGDLAAGGGGPLSGTTATGLSDLTGSAAQQALSQGAGLSAPGAAPTVTGAAPAAAATPATSAAVPGGGVGLPPPPPAGAGTGDITDAINLTNQAGMGPGAAPAGGGGFAPPPSGGGFNAPQLDVTPSTNPMGMTINQGGAGMTTGTAGPTQGALTRGINVASLDPGAGTGGTTVGMSSTGDPLWGQPGTATDIAAPPGGSLANAMGQTAVPPSEILGTPPQETLLGRVDEFAGIDPTMASGGLTPGQPPFSNAAVPGFEPGTGAIDAYNPITGNPAYPSEFWGPSNNLMGTDAQYASLTPPPAAAPPAPAPETPYGNVPWNVTDPNATLTSMPSPTADQWSASMPTGMQPGQMGYAGAGAPPPPGPAFEPGGGMPAAPPAPEPGSIGELSWENARNNLANLFGGGSSTNPLASPTLAYDPGGGVPGIPATEVATQPVIGNEVPPAVAGAGQVGGGVDTATIAPTGDWSARTNEAFGASQGGVANLSADTATATPAATPATTPATTVSAPFDNPVGPGGTPLEGYNAQYRTHADLLSAGLTPGDERLTGPAPGSVPATDAGGGTAAAGDGAVNANAPYYPNASVTPAATPAGTALSGAGGGPAAALGGGKGNPWLLPATLAGPAVALGGLGLTAGKQLGLFGSNLYPGQAEIQQEAQQAQQQSQQLESYLASGTLPPGLQAGVNAAMADAEATMVSSAAARGQTVNPQDIAAMRQRMAAQSASIATQLYQQGVDQAKLSTQLYQELMNLAIQQDQALSSSIGNFATALATVGAPLVKLATAA